jgi:hypothetical protein
MTLTFRISVSVRGGGSSFFSAPSAPKQSVGGGNILVDALGVDEGWKFGRFSLCRRSGDLRSGYKSIAVSLTITLFVSRLPPADETEKFY